MKNLLIMHLELGKLLLANFICPAVVAVLIYGITKKLDDSCKRKRHRKLALAITDAYLSDVRTGVKLIKSLLLKPAEVKLPDASWLAYQLTEGSLIEIVDLEKDNASRGFAPSTVLVRLKDYFQHIRPNVEALCNSTDSDRNVRLLELEEASVGVEEMLECIQCKLTNKLRRLW